ncbi:hypothetical protein DBV05_g2713 [Lasiodiplodia theobromae]|uniref:Cyclase n=1 Tax=Lasiodiplodia theobromae TaxID=45133 RepID=A0A5N5DL78_9PEZI|nr:hypothetical protein DBV05_g2713 [Lasiodiplodia theobromae]
MGSNAELDIPNFDDLPEVEGMPQGCAWGVFDKDGKKDVHGTLNLLTPDVVKAAAAEVKEGVSISLNWPLDGLKFPLPGRPRPVHKHQHIRESGLASESSDEHAAAAVDAWDDIVEFNTQYSSQWDSLCHYSHQPSRLSYNGARCTKDSLAAAAASDQQQQQLLPTLDHWHSRGGLVARGVLLDVRAYLDEVKGVPAVLASACSGRRISVDELEAVAAHQGVEFRRGDVLVVRTGFTEEMDGCETAEEQMALLARGALSGVENSVDAARWVWDRHFAAVASDSMAFEGVGADPEKETGKLWSLRDDMVLHQYFLSMFGLSIGEMWDLKALAAHCRKTGRYSFMLTSVPLRIPCLVGSPPNALAIF